MLIKRPVNIHSNLKFLVVGIVVLASFQSQAVRGEKKAPIIFSSAMNGILLDLNLYYGQSQARATPSVTSSGSSNEFKNNAGIYDIKIGYVWQWGGYLGAEYSLRTDEDLSGTTKGTGLGLGAGFFLESGLNLRGFYRTNETFGDYKEGTGGQLDLSYLINLTPKFVLGLVITHRTISYTTNDTIANFRDWSPSWTNPALTLGYVFSIDRKKK